MNGFAVLIRLCGLDADSAAHFLGVRRRAVLNWMKGVGEARPEVTDALSKLHQQQQKYADDLLEAWDEAGRPPSIAIEICADDEGARARGWPSVGAQLVAPMIAQTYISPARIVFQEEQAVSAPQMQAANANAADTNAVAAE